MFETKGSLLGCHISLISHPQCFYPLCSQVTFISSLISPRFDALMVPPTRLYTVHLVAVLSSQWTGNKRDNQRFLQIWFFLENFKWSMICLVKGPVTNIPIMTWLSLTFAILVLIFVQPPTVTSLKHKNMICDQIQECVCGFPSGQGYNLTNLELEQLV